MDKCLGGSAHADRTTRLALAWPRLLDVELASLYLSVGVQTVRDYAADGILQPVDLPGSTLRDKSGNVVARPRQRKIAKLLFDREDLDKFVEDRKGRA